MAEVQHIDIPDQVLTVLQILEAAGFEAFTVGGCVRDEILGRMPKDWDIATSAKPEQIKALFPSTVDTGIKHGTVTVLIGANSFEVTTYRVDGEYTDYRRPERIDYASSIYEDLSRRDFTVNAVAYHPQKGFIDPFNGLKDMENRIIRAVGDPDLRFGEDALRMLRAIRFSSQLNFTIDDPAFHAISQSSYLIGKISCERIREEITKILTSQNPQRFELLKSSDLLHYILPEFEPCFVTNQNHPYHLYDVAHHILQSVSLIESSPVFRWTMLLHDIGKPAVKTTDVKGVDHFHNHHQKSAQLGEAILTRLKFDSRTSDKILKLVELHDRNIDPTPKAVRRALRNFGEEIFCSLLTVNEADWRAQNPIYLEERLAKLSKLEDIYRGIKEQNNCTSLKCLAVNGEDLKNLGFQQGREIGKALNRLLDSVIDNPGLNSRQSLIELAKKIKQKSSRI
jgi:tRNA nucleotidyltransferase (CCA-adding enzyme)